MVIAIVLKDPVPRQLAYPVGEGYLSEQLAGDMSLDDAGLFFLFTSGIQLDHYDPLTSKEVSYPVMALDREPPPLVGHAEARLHDAERRRAELAGKTEPDEAVAYETSIVIFPVKTRMRRRVTDALEVQGLTFIRNWLAAPADLKTNQKPLVLIFDENTGRISARFAKEEGSRRMYR